MRYGRITKAFWFQACVNRRLGAPGFGIPREGRKDEGEVCAAALAQERRLCMTQELCFMGLSVVDVRLEARNI